MASRSLGTLTVDLVAKTGGFEAGLDKAARTAERRMKEIQRTATQMGTILGTALAAGAGLAAAAIIASTKAAIDNADAIRDMSIRLGTATETLSAYGYAAGQTGTDLDTLGRGLKILAKNAADSLNPTSEQAKVFEALGVSALDAEGKLKDLSVLVPDIANKFAQLEDGTTKAALAQALFGKAGLELTEFLNSGADGLADMAQRAAELGIVIDGETAAAADQFNDTLGELKAILSGVGLEIARGLLPALNDGASSLRDMAEEGDLASNAVSVLSAALQVGVGAIEAYNTAVRVTSAAMTTLVEAGQGYAESVTNLWAPWSDGTIAGGIDKARAALGNFNALAAKTPASPFANVVSRASGPQAAGDDGLEGRLARALSNPTAASGSKGGKSDAEREAEQAIKDAQRAREELERQVQAVSDAREEFDGYAAQLAGPMASANYQFAVEQERLNEIAREGEISTERLAEAQANLRKEHEANVESIRKQLDPVGELIKDYEFENELMRMGNDERELAIALRYADAAATDKQLAKLRENIRANRELAESIELQDGFRDSFAGFFEDVIGGTKSVGDAFRDMLDNINRMILQRIAENWVEQLFGASGTSGGGSSGGWMELFASLFSGGKAGGGWAAANSLYEVNERGMEMASVNGRDYLLTGNKPVEITPNNRLQTAGGGVTQNFYSPRFDTKQTPAQLAQEARIAQQLAMRNA